MKGSMQKYPLNIFQIFESTWKLQDICPLLLLPQGNKTSLWKQALRIRRTESFDILAYAWGARVVRWWEHWWEHLPPPSICDPSSNPGVDAICDLSLLSVHFLAPRDFPPGTSGFPSPQKPIFPNSNLTWNQVMIMKNLHLVDVYLQIIIYVFLFFCLFFCLCLYVSL